MDPEHLVIGHISELTNEKCVVSAVGRVFVIDRLNAPVLIPRGLITPCLVKVMILNGLIRYMEKLSNEEEESYKYEEMPKVKDGKKLYKRTKVSKLFTTHDKGFDQMIYMYKASANKSKTIHT